MIRVGYRGYSHGTLQMDERFQANMEGALGGRTGRRLSDFFSQATTVAEAEEEADFVLEGHPVLPCPVPGGL